MYSINDVFDKVYVINLKCDACKYQDIKKKLDHLCIEFELFRAIDGNELEDCELLTFGNKGAVGCKRSHMSIIRDAKRCHHSRILILEDDLYFWKGFNERFDSLYRSLVSIDPDWKTLYFGASNREGELHIDFTETNTSVYSIGERFITGAYAIGYDASVFDTILESETDNRPFDDIVGSDIQKHNYIFFPYLVYPNVGKASTTTSCNQSQQHYNMLNYVDENMYD